MAWCRVTRISQRRHVREGAGRPGSDVSVAERRRRVAPAALISTEVALPSPVLTGYLIPDTESLAKPRDRLFLSADPTRKCAMPCTE